MVTAPHNPHCRLVSLTYPTEKGYTELVLSIQNVDGKTALEAYYYHGKPENGHYLSRMWPIEKLPKKYKDAVDHMVQYMNICPMGHKLNID